jgi:hypothetical protein
VSSKKHVRVPNFLTKPPPSRIFGAKRTVLVRFGAKLFFHKNFPPFCPLSPQNRFSEKHVSGLNFFTKPHHKTIGAKRIIWHDWGQNCSGTKFRVFEKALLRSEFFD